MAVTEYQYRVFPAYLSSNLTTENFVGFMKGAALDGTNGEILSSCSIARNQTNLTPGQTYFVSPTDGSLSTTAGNPSVTAKNCYIKCNSERLDNENYRGQLQLS